MRIDSASVQFHHPLHQAKAYAQAALRTVDGALRLREQLEDAGQQFRRHANTGIAHLEHHIGRALLFNAQPDAATFVGVLGGVGKQVHQHLLQPRGVGIQPNRLRRQQHREFMAALHDQQPGGVQRPLHDIAHADPLLAKPNAATGDARNVQQVIHQMFQLPHLTLNDIESLLLQWLFVLLQVKQLHGADQGGERVAQFMAEHRQKLVLAAVQLNQDLRLLLRLAL